MKPSKEKSELRIVHTRKTINEKEELDILLEVYKELTKLDQQIIDIQKRYRS